MLGLQSTQEVTKELSKETENAFGKEMQEAVAGWGRNFSQTLNDIFWSADATFGSIVKSFAKMLTQMAIQKTMVEPILGAGLDFLEGFAASRFAPTAGEVKPWFGSLDVAGLPPSASAKGNIFSGGKIIPFGRGGVVSKPTIFPMANGMGLMGEKGYEAVMPLKRLSGGDLGIKAETSPVKVEIINNTGQGADVEQTQNAQGENILRVVIGEVAKDIRYGGKSYQAIQQTFGLARAGANR